jgi:hypothetical protein
MIYYYFDFRDAEKQNRRGLLASLLAQLSFQSNPCCEILSRLYATHDRGTQEPADDMPTTCLKDMLKLPGQGAPYIIIDRMDECPNTSGMPTAREEVLELVEDLVKLELPNVHICATSRPEIDISTVLEPLTTLWVCFHDESGQKGDIVDHVTTIDCSDLRMSILATTWKNRLLTMQHEMGTPRWYTSDSIQERTCTPLIRTAGLRYTQHRGTVISSS